MFSFHYIFFLSPPSLSLSPSLSHLLIICLSHTCFLSCTPSFSFMTHVCFFSGNLLPTPHLPPSLACNLNTVHSLVPARISHHRSLLHLLTLGSCLTSLCLFTCNPLFLISDLLSDWQISIILEDLHKSLPSHFLAEMTFLPICSVSDHIEHSRDTALIPIFSTDTAKEWGGPVTFEERCFNVLSTLQKCLFFPLVLITKGQRFILCSAPKWDAPCENCDM